MYIINMNIKYYTTLLQTLVFSIMLYNFMKRSVCNKLEFHAILWGLVWGGGVTFEHAKIKLPGFSMVFFLFRSKKAINRTTHVRIYPILNYYAFPLNFNFIFQTWRKRNANCNLYRESQLDHKPMFNLNKRTRISVHVGAVSRYQFMGGI